MIPSAPIAIDDTDSDERQRKVRSIKKDHMSAAGGKRPRRRRRRN